MIQKNKKFVMECHIAGLMYHEANEVWNRLSVGTQLSLVREEDNRYDPNAIAVLFFDKKKKEKVMLGYIPRTDNSMLSLFFDMDYNDIFETRISRINPEAHYEQQIHITVKLHRNPFKNLAKRLQR